MLKGYLLIGLTKLTLLVFRLPLICKNKVDHKQSNCTLNLRVVLYVPLKINSFTHVSSVQALGAATFKSYIEIGWVFHAREVERAFS